MNIFKKPSTRKVAWGQWLLVCLFVFSSGVSYADGIPTRQDLDRAGINYYDVVADATYCTASSSVTATGLSGSDPASQIWNYFKAKGLGDITIAGLMGNFQAESGFNPQRVQDGGGRPKTSTNPSDAGSAGYGLAQWTPGTKIISEAAKYHISGNVYDLLTQLNIIWAEMNGTTPTGNAGFLAGLQAINDLPAAVLYVVHNFEGPLIIGPRLTLAQAILQRFSTTPTTSTTPVATASSTSATPSGCSSIPPDCAAANGTAKILCAAKAYDPISYVWAAGHAGGTAWHKSCPSIDANCGLDCSGLVNIAVFDATSNHTDLRENTEGERSAIGKYWKVIPVSELQAGDIMQPETGHVEIVDHIEGTKLFTFGAHTSEYPQQKQVGGASYTLRAGQLYLHYIGPGL